MEQVTTPNLKLNGIEYLCLKMHLNPGKPARWYLRALHQYRFGTPGTGSWCAGYFSPRGRYRGLLFRDAAPKTRLVDGLLTKNCSSRGQFYLMGAGHARARAAAAKLGLQL